MNISLDNIAENGIKVTFTPSNTTNYNTVSDVNIIKQQITLSAAQQSTSYYWYVGTTKPQSLNEATIVDSYQSETIYTNTSGVKSHIFVLTNDNKSVTFINTTLNEEVSHEKSRLVEEFIPNDIYAKKCMYFGIASPILFVTVFSGLAEIIVYLLPFLYPSFFSRNSLRNSKNILHCNLLWSEFGK